MRKALVIFVAVLGLAFTAVGAEDAAGTWKASFDSPQGAVENTFLLKVDGDKVTGTISAAQIGSIQIAEGKVDGEKISFSVPSDFGILRYTGTIKGDEMKLTLVVGDGQFTVDMNAKREKI